MKALAKTRLAVLAAVAVLGSAAHATMLDATVLIDRAANDRTLTVRYNGANAALIELRINGVSAATRMVDESKDNGETSFTLDTASLADGENNVEIRLYDEDGKVVGSRKTAILVDRKASGPVYLEKPANGSTVQGQIEIKLGLEKSLKNVYVSFFIDDEFKALRNFPPYSYMFDTLSVPNGWHEVQAWVVDDSNNTFKTERMRIFVANPGGNTTRNNAGGGGTVTPNNTPVKTGGAVGELKPGTTGGQSTEVPANDPTRPETSGNKIKIVTGGATGTKPVSAGAGTASGQQTLRPDAGGTPVKIGDLKPSEKINQMGHEMIAARTGPVSITHGTRLDNVGNFGVMLDGEMVAFDVSPRVEGGVPFTPFRHLLEHGGGTVEWKHELKEVEATGMGRTIWMKVGYEFAKVDGADVRFEASPFIDSSRILVPMSFLVDSLNLNVSYDPNTGHVLVTRQPSSAPKN